MTKGPSEECSKVSLTVLKLGMAYGKVVQWHLLSLTFTLMQWYLCGVNNFLIVSYLYINTKRYNTVVISILLHVYKMWTSKAFDVLRPSYFS